MLCAGLPGTPAVSEAKAEPAQVVVSAAQVTGAVAQATATIGQAVSGPACKLKGTAPVPKGARLHDAPSGGRTVAGFTGALVPMTLSAIPAESGGGPRAAEHVGQLALRCGSTATSRPRTSRCSRRATSRSSPGTSGYHDAQKVKLVAATGDSLRAELSISGSERQTAKASAPCDAFARQRGVSTKMEIPGSARGLPDEDVDDRALR